MAWHRDTFPGGPLVISEDIPQDALALIFRLPASVTDEIAQTIKNATKDPWQLCIVDEAYGGDPNKKVVRVGRDFYLVDVAKIEALPEMHFPSDL